jgi:hypothetical protein
MSFTPYPSGWASLANDAGERRSLQENALASIGTTPTMRAWPYRMIGDGRLAVSSIGACARAYGKDTFAMLSL